MKYIIPKASKLVVAGAFEFENNPMNMCNITTFEKGEFSGIALPEPAYPSVEHQGVNSKAVGDNTNIGEGYPATIFKAVNGEVFYWVYGTINDRDDEYKTLLDFVSKEDKK